MSSLSTHIVIYVDIYIQHMLNEYWL